VTARLDAFRELVHRGIRRALEIDGTHKGYEGAMAYTIDVPSFFDFQEAAPCVHSLFLRCYVLGPSRQYQWRGTSADEVFTLATTDVERWIAELEDED
jgi:hypothetical protein